MMRKFSRSNLRRFVRGRPYTSTANIRRYFSFPQAHDEASAVEGPHGRVFISLPARAAAALGQLWHEGKIGVHFSLIVRAPVIEGVYSMESPLLFG